MLYPQNPSNCNAQQSPIYCLSKYLVINKTHSIVPLVTGFSTNLHLQNINFVGQESSFFWPCTAFKNWPFFYHNTLLTEPLLTQMTNRPLWTECTMMSQGLSSSKHLCKWCLMSRHTGPMESQQITLLSYNSKTVRGNKNFSWTPHHCHMLCELVKCVSVRISVEQIIVTHLKCSGVWNRTPASVSSVA